MKLTMFPYSPVPIHSGKLNVIGTGSASIYRQIIASLLDQSDQVGLFDENDKRQDISKNVLWIGNLAEQDNLNAIFLKPMLKLVISQLSDEEKIQLIDASSELSRLVLDASFSVDVPMEVKEQSTLETMFKMAGLHILVPQVTEVYARLELLIKILTELDNHQLVVLTMCVRLWTSMNLRLWSNK